MGVQVPPRTPKPGKFPANQASLEHAARPPAGRSSASPRGGVATTAPLIALSHPAACPEGAREQGQGRPGPPPAYGRGAAGPAVPGDVVYGTGRIDESGRVADRAMTAMLGWRAGDRLTFTAAARVVIARRDPAGMVIMPSKPYLVTRPLPRRRCGLRPGDHVLAGRFARAGHAGRLFVRGGGPGAARRLPWFPGGEGRPS